VPAARSGGAVGLLRLLLLHFHLILYVNHGLAPAALQLGLLIRDLISLLVLLEQNWVLLDELGYGLHFLGQGLLLHSLDRLLLGHYRLVEQSGREQHVLHLHLPLGVLFVVHVLDEVVTEVCVPPPLINVYQVVLVGLYESVDLLWLQQFVGELALLPLVAEASGVEEFAGEIREGVGIGAPVSFLALVSEEKLAEFLAN